MPGFNCAIGCDSFSAKCNNKDKLVTGQIKGNNYLIERFTLNKFLNDKIFVETNDYVIVIDGVILNKTELSSKYGEDWAETVEHLYEDLGDTFYEFFRGSFFGLFYDKKKDKWLFFVDHICSKPLFYVNFEKSFFISSEIKQVYDFLRFNNVDYSLHVSSAYMLVSYGYMLDDCTLCTEIKKILPGHTLFLENGSLKFKEYYHLNNTSDYSYTEDQYVDLIDNTFRRAVQLQFEKDREYGYNHVVALSGGLDSRMTTWVAHDMGYLNQLNITFSQSDYLDETIAKRISSDLKHDWIFKSLDNGTFLYYLDAITQITGGNISYQGLAHGYSLIEKLNFEKLGIFHSGQLGDAILGTSYLKKNIEDIASSKRLLCRLIDYKFIYKYINNEVFTFYQRGFNGINGALLGEQEFTETISPFYDVDFLNLALSIPVEYRNNHRIYKKWILSKYPYAAKYVWEKTNDKITASEVRIGRYRFTYKQLFRVVCRRLFRSRHASDSVFHMNPFAFYFRTNSDLKGYANSYFERHVHLIENEQLREDVANLFLSGNAVEQIQVLSLLSALNLFFNKRQR